MIRSHFDLQLSLCVSQSGVPGLLLLGERTKVSPTNWHLTAHYILALAKSTCQQLNDTMTRAFAVCLCGD